MCSQSLPANYLSRSLVVKQIPGTCELDEETTWQNMKVQIISSVLVLEGSSDDEAFPVHRAFLQNPAARIRSSSCLTCKYLLPFS